MDNIKVLAQIAPSSATSTVLYTVPAGRSTTSSSIVVCNQSSVDTIMFRISIAVAGAAIEAKQYLYYDVSLDTNDTFIAVIGITLSETDIIRVYTDIASVSFSLFGVEIA